MPQMSPISWPMVVITLIMMLLIMKSTLAKMSKPTTKTNNINMTEKTWKW